MRSGLAIGRSFARHNIDFVAAATDVGHFSCSSRYFRRRVVKVADPRSEPDRFVDQILLLAEETGAAAIIPITDAAVGCLNAARSRLPAETRLMAPSFEATCAVLDKDKNVRIAEQLGIPHPRTVEVDTHLELEGAAYAIGYPVVLKRRSQQQFIPEEIADFTIEVVHNDSELRHIANRLAAYDVVPQLQEFVLGDMHNICCFAARGKIVAAHEYFSIRRSKHAGICRQVVEVDSTRLKYAEKILGAINWEGVAGVSFLVDRESNRTWYLETNGRFWASVQGSVNAGWDFPYWAYRYFVNGEVPEPPPRSDTSKITCYHKDDLAALVGFLRGGPSPVTVGKVSKPMAIWQYLRAFGPGYESDVFSWRDPMPAIRDHGQLAKRYWRGFTRWLGRHKRQ